MISHLKAKRNLIAEVDQVINDGIYQHYQPERVMDVPEKALEELNEINDIRAFWKGLSPLNSPNSSKEKIKNEPLIQSI